MKILSLFSGIGGLDVAVERAFAGAVVAHCEADAYAQGVLKRHWPGVPCFADVRELTAAQLPAPVDVICGGFPCQDLSTAGKRAGLSGKRSGLWREYLRLVAECSPSAVVIENVPPLYRQVSYRAQVDEPLRALGYRVLWTLCRASDVGAPHRRERAFALALKPGFALAASSAPSAVLTSSAEWPTPTASDSRRNTFYAGGNPTLGMAAKWPTPTAGLHNYDEPIDSFRARQARLRATKINGNGCGTPLGVAVRENGGAWTTPTARDQHSLAKCTRGSAASGHALIDPLVVQVGGALNPAWVATLMGFPADWTQLDGDPLRVAEIPQWPMPRNSTSAQCQHEPPRLVPPATRQRCAQLRALGNAVVPQQAMFALARLTASANDERVPPSGSRQLVLM